MNIYLILLIIFAILAITALLFCSSYSNLKKYKEKMDNAEQIIENSLSQKLDLIINLNTSIKQVTGKKDYLKDYIQIKNQIISNIEMDLKLNEAEKLINDLTFDYDELHKNEEFINEMKKLRELDETLTSAKNIFNKNALDSNTFIKTIPNNIIAKILKFRIRSFYNNNKTDDMDNF